MIKNNFILAVVSIILAAQIAWAQVPATISYQGILTDVDGNIVADGDYALTFNLYDVLSGGSSIWSESQNLTVTKGIFNVILGDVNHLDLPFDKQYWSGVSIGSDPELSPRIQLTASPYSMSSRQIYGGTNIFPSDGNVGIGLTNPTEKLVVTGTIRSSQGGFKFPDGTVQTTAASGGNGGNTLDQAYNQGGAGAGRTINADAGAVNITGADGLRVNGKVGIGTTAPNDNLEISENKDGFVGISITNPNLGSSSSEGIYFSNEDGTIAGIRLYDDESVYPSWMSIFNNRPGGSIHFGTGGTSKMTLANNGNLGIGTTNPQQKLHVKGLARFDLSTTAQINISTPGGNPGIIAFAKNGHRRDIIFTNDDLRLFASSSSSAPIYGITISENGNVGINATPSHTLTLQQNSATDPIADAWTVYSSKRWKTNIKPIGNALELVERMRGVTFDWKENGKHDIGLIAEEVGEVIPEVVAYEENGIDAKSVDYARLVAVLIAGMKEQQKQINQLKERITNIEK